MRIALIDDDVSQVNLLKSYIERYGESLDMTFIIDIFCDGISFISEYIPVYDIVFMDIEMPNLDGISTARKLRKIDEKVCLIFVTNLAKYALAGYEVNAMDYMIKPVEYFYFTVKLEKALRLVEKKRTGYLSVKVESSIRRVDFDDIVLIEMFGHNAELQLIKERLFLRMSLGVIKEKLPRSSFFQCSRSIIINLKYLEEIDDVCAVVNGHKIAISRSKKSEIINAMAEYGGGIS